MLQLLHDFRLALRNLRKAPGFAAIAILTLALGIGANSAIFSVLYHVVLEPLNYPQAERLVIVRSQFTTMGFDQFWVSAPEYEEYRDGSSSYAALGAYTTGSANLSTRGEPVRAQAGYFTRSLLDVLQPRAQLGRLVSAEEDSPAGGWTVMLSHSLWQRAYGGDPDIVGQTFDVDGTAATVVGILEPGFDLPDESIELWIPLRLDPANPRPRSNHFLEILGRLKPAVTLEQARAELDPLLNGFEEFQADQHTLNASTHRLRIDPLHDDVIGAVKPQVLLLTGAVALVLLIACANVGNLLLARAESRQREISVRTALGAGRRHLLRQFLTEGLLLAGLGAMLGTALAAWGLRLLLAADPESVPRSAEIALDVRVLAFTLALTLVTGLIFGLAPMLHLRGSHSGARLSEALKEGGQRTTAQAHRLRLRRGLVVLEVALAVILVVGAGLLLRSFWNLMKVDPGFDANGLLTFRLELDFSSYPEIDQQMGFYERLTQRLAATPGVEDVTFMSGLPPRRRLDANDTEFDGKPSSEETGVPSVTDFWQFTRPGYFQAMGIPIVQGEAFSRQHDAEGTLAVVINQTLAERVWPGEDPIGQRLRPGFGDLPWFTVIGVARDVKQDGLDRPTGTELYFSYPQVAERLGFAPRAMWLALRSDLPLATLLPSVRRDVREADSTLPIARPRMMEDVLRNSVAQSRFIALLVILFGAAALLLAAVGTYGVLAYIVTERRQEIGIRMALGANRGSVLGMVLAQGMRVTVLGLLIGLAASWMLVRLAESALFGIQPHDPLTFAAVTLLIAAVAAAACYLPAWRATRVQPVEVLRDE